MPLLRHALRASFAVRFGILPPQSERRRRARFWFESGRAQ